MTHNKLIGKVAFQLVYGKEDFMPMEYIVRRVRFIAITEMTHVDALEDMLLQLVRLEEERFVAGFHQNVEKKRLKVWHDRHIKNKQFQVGSSVLMYDRNFFKHRVKLKTHFLGPHSVKEIIDGVVILEKLDGTYVRGLVSRSLLKQYYDRCDLVT